MPDEPELLFEPFPSDDLRRFIEDNVATFTMAMTGALDYQPVGYFLRQERGEWVGGCLGYVWANYLHVQWLWVAASLRGRGQGTRLLRAAETMAAENGAARCHPRHVQSGRERILPATGISGIRNFAGVSARLQQVLPDEDARRHQGTAPAPLTSPAEKRSPSLLLRQSTSSAVSAHSVPHQPIDFPLGQVGTERAAQIFNRSRILQQRRGKRAVRAGQPGRGRQRQETDSAGSGRRAMPETRPTENRRRAATRWRSSAGFKSRKQRRQSFHRRLRQPPEGRDLAAKHAQHRRRSGQFQHVIARGFLRRGGSVVAQRPDTRRKSRRRRRASRAGETTR